MLVPGWGARQEALYWPTLLCSFWLQLKYLQKPSSRAGRGRTHRCKPCRCAIVKSIAVACAALGLGMGRGRRATSWLPSLWLGGEICFKHHQHHLPPSSIPPSPRADGPSDSGDWQENWGSQGRLFGRDAALPHPGRPPPTEVEAQMGVSAERRSSQGCRVGTGHLASGWSLKALTEHLLRARPFGGHDRSF